MNRLTPDQAAAVRAAEINQFNVTIRDQLKDNDQKLRMWCVDQAIAGSADNIAVVAAAIYDFVCGKGET